jgi:hypothetical protein
MMRSEVGPSQLWRTVNGPTMWLRLADERLPGTIYLHNTASPSVISTCCLHLDSLNIVIYRLKNLMVMKDPLNPRQAQSKCSC